MKAVVYTIVENQQDYNNEENIQIESAKAICNLREFDLIKIMQISRVAMKRYSFLYRDTCEILELVWSNPGDITILTNDINVLKENYGPFLYRFLCEAGNLTEFSVSGEIVSDI